MSEAESSPDAPKPDPSAYRSLDGRDVWSTVSWYLVAAGIIALILAALCLILDRTGNRGFFTREDFSLNPRVLGRGILLVGIVCYAAGRAIAYWRRFARRAKP